MTDLNLWYENYSDFIDGELASMKASLRYPGEAELGIEFWFRCTIKRQLM